MGRPAKPQALKDLAGNPGKRKRRAPEKPDSDVPDPPDHLSDEARVEWRRLATELTNLGLLRARDFAAYAVYCETWATWVLAKAVVARDGMTYTADNGLVKMRPEVKIVQDAARQLRQYSEQFGLSPSSRAKVASILVNDPKQPTLPGIPAGEAQPKEAPGPKAAGAFDPARLSDDDYFGSGGVRH